jgi:predicted transcriptional regulator
MTWKMVRTLAILYRPDSEDFLPWTCKRLSEEMNMSQKSMQLLLGRLRGKNWVEYAKDAFGRKAWVVTQEGMAGVWKEINRKVCFDLDKGETIAENIIKIADRAIAILERLKHHGFTDVQARESIINYRLEKIEWALRVYDRQRARVNKPGAYIWTLIKYGNQSERRIRVYIKKVNWDLPERIEDMVIKEALRTVKPFATTVLVMKVLGARKDYWEITPDDVGEVLFSLYKSGKLKAKPEPGWRNYVA